MQLSNEQCRITAFIKSIRQLDQYSAQEAEDLIKFAYEIGYEEGSKGFW